MQSVDRLERERERESMGPRTRRGKKQRWIKHYKSSQKILLVGEGDFSFAACLARAFRSASKIVATCFHTADKLVEKHWASESHLEELKRMGCLILYEVDVHDMNMNPNLKGMKFDIIIFNFPHAGHFSWLCERDQELIEMHKELVEAYFKSAREMLSEGGEIHLTHRDDSHYNTWNVVKLASKAGLQLKEKAAFEKQDYPGYHNKRGGDINCNKTFPILCAFTFKFTLELQNRGDDDGVGEGLSLKDMSYIQDAVNLVDALNLLQV